MTMASLYALVEYTDPYLSASASGPPGKITVTISVWQNDTQSVQYRGYGATLDEAAQVAWDKLMHRLLQPEPEASPTLFEFEEATREIPAPE